MRLAGLTSKHVSVADNDDVYSRQLRSVHLTSRGGALRRGSHIKLEAMPAGFRVASPDGKVMQHNGCGNCDVQRSCSLPMLRNVDKAVTQFQLRR